MDWIAAQFACSLDHAFRVLRERLKADIAQWRAHPDAQGKRNVNVTDDGNVLHVSVAALSGFDGPWVSLYKSQGHLLVKDGTKELRLHPTLNAAGECRLVRDGEELDFWQASRLILQPLLF